MNENHTRIVLNEVRDERASQEKKWGEQNHPSIDPLWRKDVHGDIRSLFKRYGLGASMAEGFKAVTDSAAKAGILTYADILMEEVAEAIEAAGGVDESHLREELIQVAAVAVAWIQCIDRRRPTEYEERFQRDAKIREAAVRAQMAGDLP